MVPSLRLTPWAGHFGTSAANRRRQRVQVLVRDNNVDQALKALKKKMQRKRLDREGF